MLSSRRYANGNARRSDDRAALPAAVNELFAGLAQRREYLRAKEQELGSVGLQRRALVTAQLDPAMLGDFLAFDGTMESVSDRMMAAFERVVGALS